MFFAVGKTVIISGTGQKPAQLFAGRLVADIAKQFLSWGDTYTLDIADPGDEIMALMLVIAIDAVNCSQNNN